MTTRRQFIRAVVGVVVSLRLASSMPTLIGVDMASGPSKTVHALAFPNSHVIDSLRYVWIETQYATKRGWYDG